MGQINLYQESSPNTPAADHTGIFPSTADKISTVDSSGKVRTYHPIPDGEYDNGTATSNTTIDWDNGDFQRITLGAGITLSWSNLTVGNHQLKIIQDSTGGHTISLPTGKWQKGVSVSLTSDANAEDTLRIYYDGTDVYYELFNDWQTV